MTCTLVKFINDHSYKVLLIKRTQYLGLGLASVPGLPCSVHVLIMRNVCRLRMRIIKTRTERGRPGTEARLGLGLGLGQGQIVAPFILQRKGQYIPIDFQSVFWTR